jgi:hypothetical protein
LQQPVPEAPNLLVERIFELLNSCQLQKMHRLAAHKPLPLSPFLRSFLSPCPPMRHTSPENQTKNNR